ncbi:hypothetical protein [Parasynechococcus sp.]|uniref:hypothetical protein n=1 Tax=Parasynechococcus sp. TaxID=3101203 RepID=UPI0037047B04
MKTQSIIFDDIDTSTADNGLQVTVHDSKSASFSLALQALKNSRFIGNTSYLHLRLGSSSHSRINPITSFPEESLFASIFVELIQIQVNAGAKTLARITSFQYPSPPLLFPMKASQKTTTSLFAASSQAQTSPVETTQM